MLNFFRGTIFEYYNSISPGGQVQGTVRHFNDLLYTGFERDLIISKVYPFENTIFEKRKPS